MDRTEARFRRAPQGLALLAALGVIWAIWSVPLVLTNDGPQAVFASHVDAHHGDPGSVYERQFTLGLGLTGRGFMFLYGPLASVFEPATALRVAQALMVLAFAAGAGALARAVAGRLTYTTLLGVVIGFSWPFYMGFYAFLISTALGLGILAFVMSTPRLSKVHKLAVCVALLVDVLLHPIPAAIIVGLSALVVGARIVRLDPEQRRAAIRADGPWLVASALPIALVFIIMRGGQAALAKVKDSESVSWPTFAEWIGSLPRIAVPGSTVLGWIVIGMAVVALVLAAARARREPRSEIVGLTIGAWALLALALAGPLHLPGWQFFSPRFLGLALALALCLLPQARQPWRQKALIAGTFALIGAALWNARSLHTRHAAACDDVLRGLEARIERRFMHLPINLDTTCGTPADPAVADVPYLSPLLHMSSLFAARHGGSTPYTFSGAAAVHVLVPRAPLVPVPDLKYWAFRRDDPAMVNLETRAQILDALALYGSAYENILVFGASAADRALLLDRGYRIDFEHGSFLNAHHQPCRITVVVPVLPGDPPVLVVGGRGDEDLWPTRLHPVPEGARGSFDAVCGQLWARVAWADGGQRCRNGDEQGRLHVLARSDGPPSVVECER